MGKGVSHGIGVGGRDLSRTSAACMTLAALDCAGDGSGDQAHHRHLQAAAPSVREDRRAREAQQEAGRALSLGAEGDAVRTLEAAAVSSRKVTSRQRRMAKSPACSAAARCAPRRRSILGRQGPRVRAGAATSSVDVLTTPSYTRGRPHPMIEPRCARSTSSEALADKEVGVMLLDVVIGYGAHRGPSGFDFRVLKQTKKAA
jgi:hypothetical protein